MSSTPAVEHRTEPSPSGQRSRSSGVRLLGIVPFAVTVSLLAWMWLAFIWYYHEPAVAIPDNLVESMRTSPPDTTFNELAALHATAPQWKTDADAIRLADDLLAGKTVTIGVDQVSLALALSPAKADDVPLGTMLSLGVMDPVRVMLRAYHLNGDRRYLAQARDIILAFDSWDRHAWLPAGLAWNDHAVAARVQVLTDFWGEYRRSDLYDPHDARRVLELIARCGGRLANNRNFNVETNHGVMQNISLLELAIAFPHMPGAANYRDIAMRRLNTQMSFYVSDEGVILEHSAFYHQFGMRLLAVADRMMQMLNVPLPDSWTKKYQLAQDFYRELRRPDGTLPQFGDTDSEPQTPFVLNSEAASADSASYLTAPANSLVLYPVSGYSISWTGAGQLNSSGTTSQTVVTWSDFPSESHRHADDLSLLVWADGESWWTNVGYWPYGDPSRDAAESWNGSNAPHLADEPAKVPSGKLMASASSRSLRFTDVERKARESVVIRRQVIELPPGRWIVIDSTTGSGDRVVTSWNSAADIAVRNQGNNCYLLTSSNAEAMQTCLTAGTPFRSEVLRGSTHPFAGWQVVDGRPAPANAVVVEQPTGSWIANTFELLKHGAEPSDTAATVQWQGPEHWTIHVAGETVTRDGSSMHLVARNAADEVLTLAAPGADSAARIDRVRDNYFEALRLYPKFSESYALRRKLTFLLLVCLVASTGAMLLVRRVLPRFYTQAVLLTAAIWVAGAVTVLMHFKSIL